MNKDFDAPGAEKIIGYVFKDKELLRKCFTHASYVNEHGGEDNERLEFFGDAIIEEVVTEYLFENVSGDEGVLTAKRIRIVSRDPLLKSVKKLGLDGFVLLGHGQEMNRKNDEKLFSSIYEALVAGIYVDGGAAEAAKFIRKTIIADYEKSEFREDKTELRDYKSELQEYVQKNSGQVSYRTIDKTGPDHSPEFRVAALINGRRVSEGTGHSKKAAQAEAARNALHKIKIRTR